MPLKHAFTAFHFQSSNIVNNQGSLNNVITLKTKWMPFMYGYKEHLATKPKCEICFLFRNVVYFSSK